MVSFCSWVGTVATVKRHRFSMFSLVTGVAAYIVGSVRLLRCFSVFIVLEYDCSTKNFAYIVAGSNPF